jgi:hypothetical protein
LVNLKQFFIYEENISRYELSGRIKVLTATGYYFVKNHQGVHVLKERDLFSIAYFHQGPTL